jgi:galactokinase
VTPIGERLRTIGLTAMEAERKEALFVRATNALAELEPGEPTVRLWVPGRIEFLGKHTDYAGGRSLLCTMERGFCVVASPRADHHVLIRDAVSGETVDGSLDARTEGIAGHWGNYPLTVARRIGANFASPLVGANVAFASDLPVAAGISSSSALVVASFLSFSEINQLSERPEYRQSIHDAEDLAEYLGAVENGLDFRMLDGDRGVGTFGGSEDHTAILCARSNALARYSFCPVRRERIVDLPVGHVFVIATSGVVAEKTGAALASYNRLAVLAREAAARWREKSGRDDATLGDALHATNGDVTPIVAALGRAGRDGSETAALEERARQFAIESGEIIPAATGALVSGKLPELGALVDRSMQNADKMLHNQIPETIFLARTAREMGAVAASAFGAGFGGSVWALVRRAAAADFAARLNAGYRSAFPDRIAAEVFVTRAGPPARTL